MIYGGHYFGHVGVAGTDFDGHSALAGRRDEFLGGEVIGDHVRQAHTDQAGGGQNRAVAFVAGRFAQAGVHVATEGNYFEIGAFLGELGDAAGAAGADATALGEFVQ